MGGSLGEPFPRLDNLGEVGNKGIELLVTAHVINRPNLSCTVTASGWGNKNRVLATDPSKTPIIFGFGGATQRHQVGYVAGGYWGNSYTFADSNKDGLIDPFTEMTVDTADSFHGASAPARGGAFRTAGNF